LREAFTNIIEHAGEKTIIVATSFSPTQVCIKVSDDGTGFATTREGRGLANIRRRAAALCAKLDILPSARGTTITLSLPR
jgi:signal transduction histidine kinase